MMLEPNQELNERSHSLPQIHLNRILTCPIALLSNEWPVCCLALVSRIGINRALRAQSEDSTGVPEARMSGSGDYKVPVSCPSKIFKFTQIFSY